MSFKGVLVIFLIVSFAKIAESQTCEPFRGDPPYCTGVTYEVYLAPGQTQEQLAASLQNLTLNYNYIPGGCQTPSVEVGCSKAFRKCANTTFPAPEIICGSVCSSFNTGCADIIRSRLATAENCTAEDPFVPGSPLFASTSQTTCAAALVIDLPVTCNHPFIKHPETGKCTIKCPPPGFDDPKWQKRFRLSNVITLSMSIACELLLLVTWIALYNPDRPLYVFCFSTALMVAHLGMITGKWLSYEDWMCTSDWKIRDQSSTLAAAGGFLSVVGTLQSACWVLILLYHLVNLVWENTFQIFGADKLIPFITPHVAYHIFGWVLLPVPIIIILFAGNWINLSAGWIAYPDAVDANGWVFYGVFFIPLTMLLVLHVTLMVMLFIRIITVSGTLGLKAQARLVIMCAYFVFTIGFNVTYGWYQLSVRQKLEDEIQDYVLCTISGAPDCKEVPFLGGPTGFATNILITTLGIWIFCILVDSRLLNLWRQWVTLRGFYLGDGFTTSAGSAHTSHASQSAHSTDHTSAL